MFLHHNLKIVILDITNYIIKLSINITSRHMINLRENHKLHIDWILTFFFLENAN